MSMCVLMILLDYFLLITLNRKPHIYLYISVCIRSISVSVDFPFFNRDK